MLAETEAKDQLAVHFRSEYDDMEDEGFLQQRQMNWGIVLDAVSDCVLSQNKIKYLSHNVNFN